MTRTASAQANITIEERVINVDNIVITNKDEAAELTAGDTIELAYEITPADATDKSVIWTSSDNSVATVDENGKVTACLLYTSWTGDHIYPSCSRGGSFI